MFYQITVKPVSDRIIAVLLLVLLFPLLIVGALLAMIASQSAPIFIHQRPGLRGVPFNLIKLRTMRPEVALGKKISNMERLTPLGHFLRNWSIDELPQLINVVKGDISFVGPRPLEMRYLQSYSPEQMRRHEVKPGITGLAQVNGRNRISWEEKFRLDVQYVDSVSFRLDVKIIAKTILSLLRRNDVNSGDDHTMKPFN